MRFRELFGELFGRHVHKGPNMTQKVLPRVLPTLGAFGAAGFSLLAGATVTSAQTTCPNTATLIAINGDSITDTDEQRPVNASECTSGTLTLRLSNASGLSGALYTFVDTDGTGNDCAAGDVRDPTESTTAEPCVQVGDSISLGSASMINVNVDLSLVDDDGEPLVCGSEANTVITRTLWFLALSQDGDRSDVTDAYCYDLQVDSDPPAAPTGLNAPLGENSLNLTWNAVDDDTVNRYVIYIDDAAEAGIEGGTCVSSVLEGGDTLDDLENLPDDVFAISLTGGTRDNYDLSTSRLSGSVAAVAVAARDLAGNIGPMSQVSCLFVENTLGLWDLYEGEEPEGCSVASLRQAWPGALPSLAALFGLLIRTRRRKS